MSRDTFDLNRVLCAISRRFKNLPYFGVRFCVAKRVSDRSQRFWDQEGCDIASMPSVVFLMAARKMRETVREVVRAI